MHILIVEDDPRIAANLFDFLEARGHQCDFAGTLAEARRRLEMSPPEAVILDVGLPDGDGLAFARRLRAGGLPVPILMLTARDTLDDKLAGFEAGADDYLVKPFAMKEVEARLLALQRRAGGRRDVGQWSCGSLAYDAGTQQIRLDGVPLKLTPKAIKLLALLVQEPNRVFSRREIELAVWGREQETSENLRSLLHTVRRAVDGRVDIENRHGLGYCLVA